MMENGPVRTNIAPWLTVRDGPRALEYYMAAFGAVELYRLEDDTDRVVVAHLAIDHADFWLQEEPAFRPGDHEGIRMILTVEDPESVVTQARAAGGIEIAAITEGHGWRIGRIADPFGHHWEVGKPLP